MSKKSVQSFCHWVSLIGLSSCSKSIHILSRISTVHEDEQAVKGLLGFALALDRLANANTSVFNANTSVFVLEISCLLSSYFLSIKSIHEKF